MKKVIACVVGVMFLISNISFAAEICQPRGNTNLGPTILSGSLADKDHKNATIAKMILEAKLKETLGGLTSEQLNDPDTVLNALDKYMKKEHKENTIYQPATVYFNGIEHIAGDIYAVPVSVEKDRGSTVREWNGVLLFSAKKDGEFFRVTPCTNDELKELRDAAEHNILLPIRNTADTTIMADYEGQEAYDNNVTKWAHEDPAVSQRIITIEGALSASFVQHILAKAGIDSDVAKLALPLYIVPVTPELQERINANKVWVTAKDGTRMQVPAYGSSSANARHIYLSEDEFEAFKKAQEACDVNNESDLQKAEALVPLLRILPHEIGVSLEGCDVSGFEGGIPVNDVDIRYASPSHTDKTRYEVRDLDILAGRDYAGATTAATVAEKSKDVREQLKDFKAYVERFVEAYLWTPLRSLSAPLEPRPFGNVTLPRQVDKSGLRSQDAILDLVRKNSPEVIGNQRFIDVGGSSIDLRALIKLLTRAGINALDFLTSTTVVAGDFPLKLTMGLAEGVAGFDAKDVIQYTIDYRKWEGGKIVERTKTYTVVRKDGVMYTVMNDGSLRPFIAEKNGEYTLWNGEKRMCKAGQVVDGQMGAFAYFMSQVDAFGVKGTFRTLQPIAEAGGLGRSGGSNAMFIAMAGVLAGADLTKADIQAEAVEKEGNGEDDALAILGGYTGGQESLATLQGGGSQAIHFTEVKDEAGAYVWPVGTELIVPLTKTLEEVNERMLSHVALVQPGLPFENGKAMITRTAGGVNTVWCARAKYPEDEAGIRLHADKTLVAMIAAYGVAHNDWKLVIWSQNEHRRLRNELDKGFYEFAIQALEKKEGRPAFADVYLQILQDDPILNKYLQWHINGRDDKGNRFDLREVSLYSMTQEPLIQEVTRVVKEITGNSDLELTDLESPAGVFIPGAGGTGSPAVILAKDPQTLKRILEEIKLPNKDGVLDTLKEFNADDVLRIMGDTGYLQGYLQPKVGKPIEFSNLPEAEGIKPPEEGCPGVYDQQTGIFYIDKDKADVPEEILALPRVKLLSESPEINVPYQVDKNQKTLPKEYADNGLNQQMLAQEIAGTGTPITIDEKSALIFSEKLTFDNGVGALLPKLADAGIRVVVIATNPTQENMINALNYGKPKEKWVICFESVQDAVSQMQKQVVRFDYFQNESESQMEFGNVRIHTVTAAAIIRLLGKVCGIEDDLRMQQMINAARRFVEVAA